MKHIIRIGIALIPLTAFADPGHGAPVVHTHWWEAAGWAAVGIAVVAAVYAAYCILSSRAKRIK